MTDNSRPLSDTFLQPPPPPLPPRQRSVPSNIVGTGSRKRSASDLSIRSTPSPSATSSTTTTTLKPEQQQQQDDELASYYAHLHKHVREIKRADLSKLARPKLDDFKRTEDGVTTVQWKQFAEAWLFYILDSFTSDQVDDTLEPFSLNILKSGLDRLYTIGEPLKGPASLVRRIYRWENVLLTGTILLVYSTLWYYDLLIVCLPLAIVGYIILIRADQFAQFGVEALASTSETMATAASSLGDDNNSTSDNEDSSKSSDKNWHFWKRIRSDVGTQVHYGFAAFEKKSMNEWRSDIYKKYGPKGQRLLLDCVDRLERLKNLITWKRPEKTRLLLFILVAFSIVVAIIPVRYTVKLFYLYLGLEFFCLQALRSHYPRYRRVFNALDWLLWGIPNDAEYAMQVIRLRRQQQQQQQENVVPGKPTKSGSASRLLFGRKSVADLRSTTENHHTAAGSDPVLNPDPGKATSTAATLAAMVAGAAAGQIKQTLDEHLQTTTSVQSDSSSSNLFERKMSRDIHVDQQQDIQVLGSYGCVYRGSIPGRIILTPKAFQFRTSRMTGGRVLVHYNWDDITGIKKTKSIDVLLWHTNGLTITTTDGEELSFDNVIKRDDCFNMAAAAGEHWKRS